MTIPANARLAKQSLSLADTTELLRNLLHRVAEDNTLDSGALELLNAVAVNTALPGLQPQATAVVVDATVNANLLIRCRPNERIWVFDVTLSINAATNIQFENEGGGQQLLATFYAPNAGQGLSHNSTRGKPLPRGESLYVQSLNAVNYSVDASYAITTEDV